MLALRIERELPAATDDEIAALYGDLLRFWAAGLLPHFHAEGECVLARLIRRVPEDHADVRRLQRDHLRMEALVATMRDARDLLTRRSALSEFGERLRTHVRWEERSFFPEVEAALSEEELDAVGEDLAERLPEHPLPAPLGARGLARGD